MLPTKTSGASAQKTLQTPRVAVMVAWEKLGRLPLIICCNIVIILYADRRIVRKVYFEEDESNTSHIV